MLDAYSLLELFLAASLGAVGGAFVFGAALSATRGIVSLTESLASGSVPPRPNTHV